jgi:hypothetical protein
MSRVSNHWNARRAIVARASAIIVLHTARVVFGAPPAAVPVDVPDVAKTVVVSDGGKTIALDQAIESAAASERLLAYRQLRAEVGGSGKGQLQVAQWCRQQKMTEEERLHWQIVLSIWPGQPDAIKALGLRPFEGQLLTKDQIEAAKKDAKLMREAKRKWSPKLKRIKSKLEGDDAAARQAALDELEAIRDPHALRLAEEMFADNSTGAAILLVEMYGRDAKQQSTDALVRLALHAKEAAVRAKAAAEMRYRENYMPSLIGALAAPIELSVTTDMKAGGPTYKWWDGYAYLANEAGAVYVVPGLYRMVRLDGKYTNRDVAFWVPATIPFSGWWYTGDRPDQHKYEFILSSDSPDPNAPYEYHGVLNAKEYRGENGKARGALDREIAALDEKVREFNEASAELNGRVDAAIREVLVGKDGGELPAKVAKAEDIRPRLWWDWWQQQLNLNNYFAKGTEVWTQLGLLPIEQVLVGDRVLSKDLDTGKLAFNLVIGIDVQRDREASAIEVGGRTIVTTADQPFFVKDEQWRKAKELKPGMKLDGLAGEARVESARPATADEVYSLLIAEEPTYFVDRQGILVHDATRE